MDSKSSKTYEPDIMMMRIFRVAEILAKVEFDLLHVTGYESDPFYGSSHSQVVQAQKHEIRDL